LQKGQSFLREIPEEIVRQETTGEAWNLSWQTHMRCLDDGRRGLKHKRECGYRTELDMNTLVCTRGTSH